MACRSRPARGEWIEILNNNGYSATNLSRPARGEWIEIIRAGRCGSGPGSRPARGEWIEIRADFRIDVAADKSRPARGEWIEIEDMGIIDATYDSLAPHGASGLKFQPRIPAHRAGDVSPRTGRVD